MFLFFFKWVMSQVPCYFSQVYIFGYLPHLGKLPTPGGKNCCFTKAAKGRIFSPVPGDAPTLQLPVPVPSVVWDKVMLTERRQGVGGCVGFGSEESW